MSTGSFPRALIASDSCGVYGEWINVFGISHWSRWLWSVWKGRRSVRSETLVHSFLSHKNRSLFSHSAVRNAILIQLLCHERSCGLSFLLLSFYLIAETLQKQHNIELKCYRKRGHCDPLFSVGRPETVHHHWWVHINNDDLRFFWTYWSCHFIDNSQNDYLLL